MFFWRNIMLSKYRLEIIVICLIGFIYQPTNSMLFITVSLFFLYNLFVNIFILKDIHQNKNRIDSMLNASSETKDRSYKFFIKRFLYFGSLVAMVSISIYLQKPYLITIAVTTALIEVYKIWKIKSIIKNNKSLV
jgi:hypothetical protein